ncbi:MAG TPA: hypothetical protein VMY78_06060 [Solirubrobacteraceae bacterium]|nr:hypothetical protein [Solirubrobacteraceae bacterium]
MRTPTILTAVVLTLAAAATPATAAPVSPSQVRFPQVAVNANGTTAVAWERLTRGRFAVEARLGRAPLKLGRTRKLARQGFNPQVAVGADGTAAVMWLEQGSRGMRSVRVAVARPRHGFGTGQLVERRRANMGQVGVAVQPSGRVVAVWRRSSSELAFALAPRNRAFRKARALTAIGPITSGSMALDPRDGVVVVAYGTPLSLSPLANQQAGVRTLAPAASAFSGQTVLTATGIAGEASPVAVAGPGGAAVASTISGDRPSLSLARRAADGSWSAPELVADTNYGEGRFARGLKVALPADGSAVAAWANTTENFAGLGGMIGSQVVASFAPRGGRFGAPRTITPEGVLHGVPSVAAAGNEAFVASAVTHGPVLLAGVSEQSIGVVPLTGNGDGDVLLAAGGSHVVAIYQRDDRLRLKIVR